MTSRSNILNAVIINQPKLSPLPDIGFLGGDDTGLAGKFTTAITNIGGQVVNVETMDDIRFYILHNYGANARKVTTVDLLADIMELVPPNLPDPHSLQDVDNAVIETRLAVAENGAVWVTDDKFPRALPFIAQHLAIIINVNDIVATMHEAYKKIGNSKYGFGTFIAGPSKTADIEQSLVLGAHGARSTTIFLISY
jgi:L-lactate dehydrogenase complex protein LldG